MAAVQVHAPEQMLVGRDGVGVVLGDSAVRGLGDLSGGRRQLAVLGRLAGGEAACGVKGVPCIMAAPSVLRARQGPVHLPLCSCSFITTDPFIHLCVRIPSSMGSFLPSLLPPFPSSLLLVPVLTDFWGAPYNLSAGENLPFPQCKGQSTRKV